MRSMVRFKRSILLFYLPLLVDILVRAREDRSPPLLFLPLSCCLAQHRCTPLSPRTLSQPPPACLNRLTLNQPLNLGNSVVQNLLLRLVVTQASRHLLNDGTSKESLLLLTLLTLVTDPRVKD